MSTTPPGARGMVAIAHARNGRHVFTLPLPGHKPPTALSPNGSHGSWRPVARARRAIKAAVQWRIREARVPKGQDHVHVELHYVPKDRRRRDADNLVPVLKPCLDALVREEVIPDDTPEYVTWVPPIIHDPDQWGPRMWLEVTIGRLGGEGDSGVVQGR